jgi:purine nucleosidase
MNGHAPVSSPKGAIAPLRDGLPVFHLDCAARRDDLLALAYLAASPKVHLAGVGVHGADAHARRFRHAARTLLDAAGRTDTPVVSPTTSARQVFSDQELPRTDAEYDRIAWIAGPRRTTATARSAGVEGGADLLVRLAREHRGRLRVLALGPLTTLAEALRLEPDLPRLIREVTVTGGAVFAEGDTGAACDPHFAADPEAVASVLGAEWPLTLLPLELADAHALSDADAARIARSGGPVADEIAGRDEVPSRGYEATEPPGARGGVRGVRIPIGAAVATGEIVPNSAPTMQLAVDTATGAHRGRLRHRILDMGIATLGAPHLNRVRQQCRVVLSVPCTADRLITERILGLRTSSAYERQSRPA